MRRTPGQNGQGGWVREQQQIRLVDVHKAADGGSIKGNALLKGAGQLTRHDGNIFLGAKDITECQTDKFYVIFRHILHNFAERIIVHKILLNPLKIQFYSRDWMKEKSGVIPENENSHCRKMDMIFSQNKNHKRTAG